MREEAPEGVKVSSQLSYYKHDRGIEVKAGGQTFQVTSDRLPFRRVVMLNASLIGYLEALGVENRIVGVSSPEYIFSDRLRKRLAEGAIQEVGNEQKYDVEKILALKPDVVLTNYIPTFEATYDLLRSSGVPIIFLNEYMEQNPLEKSKYLLLFGVLFDKKAEAEKLYAEIESRYNALKAKARQAKTKPVVLANEMYGGQWFMPGGRTQLALFLSDAGADYILKDDRSDRSVPMTFEEVLIQSAGASFWVNVGAHQSRKSLLAVNPVYEKLAVFRNGKLYAMSGRQKGKANDFFEMGNVRSDLVLRDYVKIFHPDLVPADSLVFMKPIN
ncbi:ABC transporter substrate-binding protein [Bergeyella sp. RCAD1439]|uniref:ABC transporter substrate-binding protein n=1 Tax=Bergeyella anatis TaxID=3113737 RepID=UPI002E1773CB|nr:ABC transporter substrate-binding protein [Bergeyella sp. RCAD1439]